LILLAFFEVERVKGIEPSLQNLESAQNPAFPKPYLGHAVLLGTVRRDAALGGLLNHTTTLRGLRSDADQFIHSTG
jgi:hypothetical protein